PSVARTGRVGRTQSIDIAGHALHDVQRIGRAMWRLQARDHPAAQIEQRGGDALDRDLAADADVPGHVDVDRDMRTPRAVRSDLVRELSEQPEPRELGGV